MHRHSCERGNPVLPEGLPTPHNKLNPRSTPNVNKSEVPWRLRSRSASIHEDAILTDLLHRWWVWLIFAVLYFFTVDLSSSGLIFDLIVLGVLLLIAIVLLITNKRQYGTFDKDP